MPRARGGKKPKPSTRGKQPTRGKHAARSKQPSKAVEVTSNSSEWSGSCDGWQPSNSPEESWSDEDREWPVEAIVGEEIDLLDVKRYQVRWKDWKRADGTDTTWERELPGDNDLLQKWEDSEAERKENLARATRDIELATLAGPVHNIRTAEDREACAERVRYWLPRPRPQWGAEIDLHRAHCVMLVNEAARGPRRRPAGDDVPRRSQRSRSESLGATPPPRPAPAVAPRTPVLAAPPMQLRQRISSTPVLAPRASGSGSRLLRTRATLEGEWNDAVRKARAAPVMIVNDVDDEEYPPVSTYFEYREARCTYGVGVPRPADCAEFLTGCECGVECTSVAECSCVALAAEDERSFAYDDEGRFLFKHDGEVVECNRNCACDKYECPNRVAQRPRDVPIEVFKTPHNGWGVRAPEDIPKGKVLGLYTGKIITREELNELPVDEKIYAFDLDARDGDRDIQHFYSVHAATSGNWTRFINHSCVPVMKVYSVVFDTVAEMNMPHLALVATQDVPAYMELTIDYDPREPRGPPRGKGKRRIPQGCTSCLCGADECRGWL